MAKRKTTPWVQLVKDTYQKVEKEEKLEGADALKEAMKRAKKIWVKRKKKKK